jgi:hypothetical protein
MEKKSSLTPFYVHANNDKFWHICDLVKFLSDNQHKQIQLIINPEAIDLSRLGLYDILDCFIFKGVEIYTCNPFESHPHYKILHTTKNIFLEKQIDISPDLHCWSREKKFLTIYGRATAGRLGLAGYLYKYHKDLSLIHFSTGNSQDELAVFELDKLASYDVTALEGTVEMIEHMPLLLNARDGYDKKIYNYNDPLTGVYQHIFVDIVAETHVLGSTFFVTEKTLRPMWLKKPFIIFGSCDYLLYLRQMGFKTFGNFWDEEYDGYEGPDRFKRILSLIDELAKKSTQELESMYLAMSNTLNHNYQLLQEQSYNTKINKV